MVATSWSTSTCFWTFFFLIDFFFSTNALVWARASPCSSDFGVSGMGFLVVDLVDFLGNSFLTSCLLVTFSLPLDFLGPDLCVSLSGPFFLGDFGKNNVIVGYFASLFVGKGGNDDSSLSLSYLTSSLSTFSCWFCWSTLSTMISTACVAGT